MSVIESHAGVLHRSHLVAMTSSHHSPHVLVQAAKQGTLKTSVDHVSINLQQLHTCIPFQLTRYEIPRKIATQTDGMACRYVENRNISNPMTIAASNQQIVYSVLEI
jgi:hypothetical protein